jgi:hypothetical protein
VTFDARGLFDRFRASGFAGLEGSAVNLRLAMGEELVNDLLAEEVVPKQPALRELRVAFKAGNRIDVRIKSTATLLPSITVKLEVDPIVALSPEPALTFRLRREGVSALVASALPQFASRLPSEVRIDRDGNGTLDLGHVLRRARLEWLVPYLASAEMETLDGQIMATARVQL